MNRHHDRDRPSQLTKSRKRGPREIARSIGRWLRVHLRRSVLLAIVILLVILLARMWLQYYGSVQITVGTGPIGGSMLESVQVVREVWQKDLSTLKVELVQTEGTNDHLSRLRESGARHIDLALITENPDQFIQKDTGLRSIGRVFENPLEVIATKASKIEKLGDITAGHRIALPPRAAGSSKRVDIVIEHYRLKDKPGVIFLESSTIDEVGEKLRDGVADVGFFGGALPLPAVASQLREGSNKFRFVDIEYAEAIARSHAPLFATTIPAGTYCANPAFPEKSITAIGSYVTLVGDASFEDRVGVNVVYDLTQSLFSNRSYLGVRYAGLGGLSEQLGVSGGGYQLFKGSKRFYEREKPINWSAWSFVGTASGLVIALAMLIIEFRLARVARNS